MGNFHLELVEDEQYIELKANSLMCYPKFMRIK